MTVAALGVLVCWRALAATGDRCWRGPGRPGDLVRGGVVLGVAAGLAGGISAIQLLPTLELSRLSIRGGGLSYQIASFDALPWPLLLPALFPGYWMHLPTTEFFGHLGTVLFAIAWLGLLAGAGRPAVLGAVYVALGLLLAVGDATPAYRFLFDWAPGFASFRVPARWLLVSTFGLAILAAVGTDWLVRWSGGGSAGLLAAARRIGPVRLGLAGVGGAAGAGVAGGARAATVAVAAAGLGAADGSRAAGRAGGPAGAPCADGRAGGAARRGAGRPLGWPG